MSGDREGTPSKYLTKEWVPIFSKDRNFKEDGSWKHKFADGDDVGSFLQEYEGSLPCFRAEEIERYCQGASLDDLQSGAGSAGQRRAAWLDDRSCEGLPSSSCVRKYENPLTATGLCRHLKIPRFDIANLSDADRRLIFVANLNPYYILALGETASFHQVSALRDAIWRHLFLQTLIRVKIPPRGYPIFQMMLHIPYFALRASLPPKPTPKGAVHNNPPRQWTDLSFLEIPDLESQDQRKYCMHEAQISFVICGSDDQRWAAYAFVDTHFDGEDLGEEIFGVQDDPIQDDPIARCKFGGEYPIGDPREYFLMIFEIRSTEVREEWEHLVRMVERNIKRRRNLSCSSLSLPSETAEDRVEDAQKAFEWTRQTIDLLSQLQERLSDTIEAWGRFSSSNGDIGYFSDIDCSPDPQQRRNCINSLAAIKETFEVLEDLQRKLVVLDKFCQNSAQALHILFNRDSSEAARDNVVSTELTVLITTPFALATGFFNIPQAVIPFKMTFKSFAAVVFVIMIVVRLSFSALSALTRRRKKAIAWTRAVPLGGMARRFLTNDYGRRFVLRGGGNTLERSLEGV